MTSRNYSAPPGTCAIPGCTNPRHVSRNGRRYTHCYDHYRADYKKAANHRRAHIPEPMPTKRLPVPAPDAVRVLVIDWKTEQVFSVTGVVECVTPFPHTDGEMKLLIAAASRDGIYVAYMRAYKEEDLYESP